MDVLTTKEAATELGLSVRAVQDLIVKGRLPAQRVGRDYIILHKDLAKARKRPGRGRPAKKEE